MEGKDGGGLFAEERGPENEDDVAELFGDFESEKGDDGQDETAPEPVEAEAETTKALGIRQPGQPSRKDVEEHNLTHADFRDWCELCAQGKGRKDQHRRAAEEEESESGAMTTYSIDYMYLTEEMDIIDEKEAEKRKLKLGKPILVGHDRRTGAVHAHQVTSKGIADG